MVATLNIILPLISQGIISSIGFIVSLAIDVVLSLVYQGITVLGCGGCCGGGGALGALGGGGICTMIMSYVAAGMTVLGGMFGGVFGLTGGGIAGGIGGFSIGDLIQFLPGILGSIMQAVFSALSFIYGLL